MGVPPVADVWPVRGEHKRRLWLALSEGDGAEACVLKGETESAGAAEQVKVGWSIVHAVDLRFFDAFGLPAPGARPFRFRNRRAAGDQDARAAEDCCRFANPPSRPRIAAAFAIFIVPEFTLPLALSQS